MVVTISHRDDNHPKKASWYMAYWLHPFSHYFWRSHLLLKSQIWPSHVYCRVSQCPWFHYYFWYFRLPLACLLGRWSVFDWLMSFYGTLSARLVNWTSVPTGSTSQRHLSVLWSAVLDPRIEQIARSRLKDRQSVAISGKLTLWVL